MSDTNPEDGEIVRSAIDTEINIDIDDILIVRRGPGANCSSIGSALDVLFLSAVAAGAVMAGIAAALGEQGGGRSRRSPPRSPAKKGEESATDEPNAADDKQTKEPNASST